MEAEVERATDEVSLVTCRSQYEFTRLYIRYEVCQSALNIIGIDITVEWFNFRNIRLQRFSAIASAIKELFANIGEKEIIKQMKPNHIVYHWYTTFIDDAWRLIIYIKGDRR